MNMLLPGRTQAWYTREARMATDERRPFPLSGPRLLYWLYDRRAATAFTFAWQSEHPFTRGDMEAALRGLIDRHPHLGDHVRTVGRKAFFEPRSHGSFMVDVRELAQDDPWAAAAIEVDRPFPEDGFPPLRAVLLPDRRFLLSFHHAWLDARSALFLASEIGAMLRGDPLGPVAPPSPLLPLGQLYPARFRGPRGLWSQLKVLLTGLAEYVKLGIPKEIPGVDPAGLTGRLSRVLCIELPPGFSEILRDRCHTEGCTVQGALAAAQLLGVQAEANLSDTLSLASAVDLRPLLEPPRPVIDLDVLISLLTTTHRVGPGMVFWDLARQVHDVLDSRIALGQAHLFWTLFPGRLFPLDMRGARLLDRFFAMAPPSTVLTNVGVVVPPPGWRLLGLAAAPSLGMPFTVAALSADGDLRLCLTFNTRRIGEDRARRIADLLRSLLMQSVAAAR